MNLGLKIKELRKQNNITQDKLAEYLNISYQAISKWENGSAYPDIKLLPSIANYFDVSIDYLLENTKQEKEKEIKYALDMYITLFNQGKLQQLVELLESTLKKYPNEFELMVKLATVLTTFSRTSTKESIKENSIKAAALCNRVINDCTDMKFVDLATTILFYCYIDIGENSKAIDVANKRPSMYYSKEMLLYSAYSGKEANEYIQSLIATFIDQLSGMTFSLTYQNNGGDKYLIEEKIQITKQAIHVIESFIPDENKLFFGLRLRRFYTYLGYYYNLNNQSDEMYIALEKAKELALYYDNLEDDLYYTSIFLESKKENKTDTFISVEMTELELLLEHLNQEEYKQYQNDKRFIQLQQ